MKKLGRFGGEFIGAIREYVKAEGIRSRDQAATAILQQKTH